MVNTGYLIADQVKDIRVALLGIHRDDVVLTSHILQIGGDRHLDAELRNHIGCGSALNISVMTDRGGYLESLQKHLKSVGTGDCVRVREVVRLDKNPVSF